MSEYSLQADESIVEILVQKGLIERELVDKAAELNGSITIRVEVRWNQSYGDQEANTPEIPLNVPFHLAAYNYSATDFVSFANNGDIAARRFLKRICQYGVTKNLVTEINSRLAGTRLCLQVEPSTGSKRIEKKHCWLPNYVPTTDESLILAMVEFIRANGLERLKECAAGDCENLHFRRGKWCCDTCGSRQRVRNKRRLDRERQMI